jgi:hypothetical protein
MRLGFLDYEKSDCFLSKSQSRKKEVLGTTLGLLGIFIVLFVLPVGFFWEIASDTVDYTWPHRILFGGVVGILVVVAIGYFIPSSKEHQSGTRLCHGVIWNPDNGNGMIGDFHIKVDPSTERSGILGERTERINIIEVIPSEESIEKFNFNDAEIILSIYLECHRYIRGGVVDKYDGEYYSHCTLHIDNINRDFGDGGGKPHCNKVLLGSILLPGCLYEANQIFSILQEIGIGTRNTGVKIRLWVSLPELREYEGPNRQGGLAGLASSPGRGLAGGLAASALGLSPAIGVIAAAATLGSAHSSGLPAQSAIEAWQRERINKFVYGCQGKPQSESLKSVAEEFGWEIVPPPGYQFPGIGIAKQPGIGNTK